MYFFYQFDKLAKVSSMKAKLLAGTGGVHPQTQSIRRQYYYHSLRAPVYIN
jgi:hypothetical protein